MKKLIFLSVFFAVIAGLAAFTLPKKAEAPKSTTATTVEVIGDETIKWYTWDEAIEASKKNPKKIFIDVYTDWCGWCKRMDANTFSKAEVAAYLNKNFYPVKFDAEQKEKIEFNGHTFEYIAQGRRGVHTLAYSLLDGKLGYPAVVYLDEEKHRITVSPGYKEPTNMMQELKFIAEEHYKTKSWQEYLNSK